MTKELLQQALDALEGLFGTPKQYTGKGAVAVWRLGGTDAPIRAITALKAAIAQPEQVKPFTVPGAWFPVGILGHPMREYSPQKWESAKWPSEVAQQVAKVEPAQPVPPFEDKRKAAMAVYSPPFKYLHGYIYDAQKLMVADNGGIDDAQSVEGAIAARVRGWGQLGYLPNGAELQDEIGQMMAYALNTLYSALPASKVEPTARPVMASPYVTQEQFDRVFPSAPPLKAKVEPAQPESKA